MQEDSNISRESVRSQLDEILAKEIVSFIDVDSNAAMMSFNLATISCIIIIVEREREIKQFPDSPPERFTPNTFISELADIGLDHDEYLETAVSTVIESGYISLLANKELKAEMPAFMMAGFLDSMFPGMQGLNLIAFILQINEEVNSGRKSIELAKLSFETTLKTRGVSVSKDKAQQRATEMAKGVQPAGSVQSKQVSAQLKKANLNKLSKLMKSRKQRTSGFQEKVKVKNLFDKGPTKEEIEAEKRKRQREEEAAKEAEEMARQLAEKEAKIKEAEEAAKELEEQLKIIEKKEKEAEAARAAVQAAKEQAEALAAREAEMAEKEAKLKAMEEEIKLKEAEAKEQATLKASEAKEEDDIESRIAEFEQSLAMPCPLCNKGRVEEKATEKGKVFYSCNQKECRFVSWDKPYHFECPLCKNPFLVETVTPTGLPGLKCPRASCSYAQDNLLAPAQHMAATQTPSDQPKKKKKLVRRVKRR